LNSNESNSNPAPLIDVEQLQSACGGDNDLMRELMDMYFGQADQIMAGLTKAVQGASVPDVNHLAHKLAGSSLACGLVAIVPPLRRMEMGAKEGHLNGAEASLAEAAVDLEKLRVAVKDYLATIPKAS
jgi:HPt (histidine-containing phosphotransfer) domain-containing protein